MTQLYFADRVAAICRGTGTGPLALDEALAGYRGFAGTVPPLTDFAYAICGLEDASEWECGIGQIGADGRLMRGPAHSSDGGGAVDFTNQIKTVTLTVTAAWLTARQDESEPPDIADVAGLEAALTAKQPLGDYALASHGHSIAQVTDLQSALDGKQAAGSYAASIHGHVIANITGLQTALDGKQASGSYAASAHVHAIGDVTGLQTALDGKQVSGSYAAASHTHSYLPLTGGPLTGTLSIGSAGKLGVGVAAPLHGIDLRSSLGIFASAGGQIYLGDGNFSNATYALAGPGIGAVTDGTGVTGGLGLFAYPGSTTRVHILTVTAGGSKRLEPAADNDTSLGTAAKRFSVVYAGSGSINTSDEREKRDIGPVPDQWLNAWGEVEWNRYRFVTGKRWHVGLVAQRIRFAFQRYNIDAFEIGLLCKDKFGRRTRWGLRYDECFAMEAAWVRRELDRLRHAE